jgi:hypothetical protein
MIHWNLGRACRTCSCVAALLSLTGCFNPAGPSNSGSGGGSANPGAPVTEILWKNGAVGTWFGDVIQLEYDNATTVTAPVIDNITGDTTSLLMSTEEPVVPVQAFNIFAPDAAPNASSVVQSGHLQFDAMLANPLAGSMTIGYGSNPSGPCFVAVVPLASLNTVNFTHISILASNLVPIAGCSAGNTQIQMPFYISFSNQATSTNLVYLGDIQWTSY